MSAGEYLGFIYPGIILLYGIFWMFRKYICTRSFDVQKQGVDGVSWRPEPRDCRSHRDDVPYTITSPSNSYVPCHHDEPYTIPSPSDPYVPCRLSFSIQRDTLFQHSSPIMVQPSAPELDTIEIAPVHESRLPASGQGTTNNFDFDPPPPYPGSLPRVCLNVFLDITPVILKSPQQNNAIAHFNLF